MKSVGRFFSGLLFAAMVLYGQNALAIATAGSTAYFDWSTYQVSGPGSLTYTSKDTWYQEGYTIPNNAKVESPWRSTGGPVDQHWDNDRTTMRNNPAGPTIGYAIADSPINAINGHDPSFTMVNWTDLDINDPSTGQGLFAKVYAEVGPTSSQFGDNVVDQYSASATSEREGKFTVDVSGTYTFSIEYNLLQAISVETYNGTDLADTGNTFWFYGGYVDGLGVMVPTPTADSGGYSHVLAYDPIYEPYDQTFSTTGILTFTMDLIAGQEYWMSAWVFSDARAGSDGQQTPPVPEPATFVLFGTGIAGLALRYRRKKGGEEA